MMHRFLRIAQFQLPSLLAFRTARIGKKNDEIKEVIRAIRFTSSSVKAATVEDKIFSERDYQELVDQRKCLDAQLKRMIDMEAALHAERREWQRRLGGK